MKTLQKTYRPFELITKFVPETFALSTVNEKFRETLVMSRIEDVIAALDGPLPPVRMDTPVLAFVSEGTLNIMMGTEAIQVLKNQCISLPIGQIAAYKGEENNAGYILTFQPSFLAGKIGVSSLLQELDFLNIWCNPLIQLDEAAARAVHFCLDRMYEEYQKNQQANTLVVQAYLVTILCELKAAYQPEAISISKSIVHLTIRFKELLHANFKTTQRVSDYAAMLNVSPNHLNKSVKTATQKTVSRWIDETLIMEAKVLLYTTHLSIGEIADELGIQDQSYFSRLFKKYEGVTPSRFRSMMMDA